jgi:hypothetical protein
MENMRHNSLATLLANLGQQQPSQNSLAGLMGSQPGLLGIPPQPGGLLGLAPGQQTHPMNNRPILQNPDGSIATEESITITHPQMNGGRPTNIPSIWGGQRPPHQPNTREFEDWAVDQANKSGQTFNPFNSIEEAVRAAQERSNMLGKYRP